VLYEMLTGELPLGRFQPPSQKVQIDVRIDEVVLRALEKEPERRFQRASEVKSGLASAAAPAWQTPALANKQRTPGLSSDQPLNPLLAVAIGMVLGVLTIAGGLAAGIYGTLNYAPWGNEWWGFMGATFGCVIGGFGSVAGSYNTYRQMAGAEDLMKSPRTTWFDWTIRAYLVFGLILLAFGFAALVEGNRQIWQPLLTLAAVVVLQGGLFVVFRMLLRPAAGDVGTAAPLPFSHEPVLSEMASAFGAAGTVLRGLSRSQKDQWLGGVCGGLGEATPIPAWCWRLLFLVLVFGYGVSVIPYVLLWICLPEGPAAEVPEEKTQPRQTRGFSVLMALAVMICLLFVGAWLAVGIYMLRGSASMP
jgi:phage shock protein PspC (stress-responsive transcriptional regulator)